MRVITLAGSPRYPSRSSALLEYARETLSAADIEFATGTCRILPRKTCSMLASITPLFTRLMNSLPARTG